MKIPNPVQVENGDVVKIFPVEKPHIYDKAPSGRLCVDGDISIEEEGPLKNNLRIVNNYKDLINDRYSHFRIPFFKDI